LYSSSRILAFVGETRLAAKEPSSRVFTPNLRTVPFPNDPQLGTPAPSGAS
jgi:hypothetical protein